MAFIHSIVTGFFVLGSVFAGLFSPQTHLTGAADTTLPVGGTTYNLSGSGVSSSATSITLSSLTIPQTGQKLLDADFSDTFYATLEPGSRTRQEFVSCTTVTQNGAGTATLSGCTRGLAPISPYTASTSLQFAHAGGAQVIFSDPPQLFRQFYALANAATSSNVLTFSSTTPPRLDSVAAQGSGTYISTTSEFASIAYVLTTTLSGAANATESVKGLSELATQIESASSSVLGGTGAGLVLQSRYATSAPSVVCGVCIPTTNNDGKISPALIATSSAYTYNWGAANIFAASTTFAATTTIKASSTTTAPLILNGVAYSFGTSRAASSSVLSEDGFGGLTFEQPFNKVVSNNGNVNLFTTSSATTTLYAVAIPANTLSTNGSMRITSMWHGTGSTNCYAEVHFGNGSATTTVGWVNGFTAQRTAEIDVMMTATSTTGQDFQGKGYASGSKDGTWASASPNLLGVETGYNSAALTFVEFSAVGIGSDSCGITGETIEILRQ